MGTLRIVIGMLLAVALSAASDARAGLYRCEKADGRVTYTDNPAACPSARPYEPTGAVQNVLGAPAPSVLEPTPQRRDLDAEVEATAEATWRQRKEQKQAELEHLESRQEHLREMVTWCNHGGEVVRTDEIGIKRKVSCSGIRSEYATLQTKIAATRHYLDEEIEDECRRSGCLPGWIR